jgi:indole-3-glycerol phosphate synthase/phosphoribosylanthranilate isomerase
MPEPGGILGEILAVKRREIATGLAGVTLDSLRRYARPTRRSLRSALARPGARFIMEMKRRSPSGRSLAPAADAAATARFYSGAADAISVLTDRNFFGGSLDDLAEVRKVFDGPILAKDFMIDPRQVVEARIHGADAILVMLSVLSPDDAQPILAEAKRLGMDALVEVHDEREARQAVALGAPLIGINNRDLKSLRVDLGTTERLAPLIPADRTLIAESGIAERGDVERLAPLVDGFLVGSTLMRSEAPARKARQLAFGRVKLCGLASPEDALAAADKGASYAGLVFVAGTPRAVDISQAERILGAIEGRGLKSVGVFRDCPLVTIARTVKALGLDIVQLHGSETARDIADVRHLLGDTTHVWAASGVGDGPPAPRDGADRTLFDTAVNGRSGGTGQTFDWSRLSPELARKAVLAGGLKPANVRSAAATGAWALDVGSGVEAAPGRKDPKKMSALFEALRPPARKERARCA